MAADYPVAIAMWAHSSNYRMADRQSVSLIVCHCTDGRAKAEPVAEMWQQPGHGSSAHFVIGQDGAVIQCVPVRHIAYHAHKANQYSVGIEHCARTPKEFGADDKGLPPSDAQYEASAKLVAWLCAHLGIMPSRVTIVGHAEADSMTTHQLCPTGCGWDWSKYMSMVADEYNKQALVA